MKQILHQREDGITLVEIIIVVTMMIIFAAVLIADFPGIEEQFYLTRAAYQLAQDLRKVEDLSLSGSYITNSQGNLIPISGYGLYINSTANDHEYILYADSCFDSTQVPNNSDCDQPQTPPAPDCEYTPAQTSWCSQGDYYLTSQGAWVPSSDSPDAESVDLDADAPEVVIWGIGGTTSGTSIDFTPPNPTVAFQKTINGQNEIVIILGLRNNPLARKTVVVNSAGFIDVQ